MTTNQTRTPLLALLASLIQPGLGQLYNGQLIKGLIIFFVLALMPLVTPWLALHSTKHLILLVIVLFLILALAIYIYALVDAYRNAKRISSTYTLKGINRPYVYLIMFIAGYLFMLGTCHYTRNYQIQSIRMASQSMLPNVLPGDHIFVDKRTNCQGCKGQLEHGNLAVFIDPNDRKKFHIKRIIGLPGDTIEIKGTDITLNGIPLRSEDVTEFSHQELNSLLQTHAAWREKCDKAVYTVFLQKNHPMKENASFTVPDGHLYVLSDNRSETANSYQSNIIPLSDVIGVAKQVWFSRSTLSGIRWWRTGFPVEANY